MPAEYQEASFDKAIEWIAAWAVEHDTIAYIGSTGRVYVLCTRGEREFCYMQEIAPNPSRAAAILHKINFRCHRE